MPSNKTMAVATRLPNSVVSHYEMLAAALGVTRAELFRQVLMEGAESRMKDVASNGYVPADEVA